MKNYKVLILGKGKIGKAVAFYLKKIKNISKIAFFTNERKIKNFDLLIGALPGQIGEEGVKLALKYKKNLIDVADLEMDFYQKKKKEIEKAKLLVIPNCGFCPGLVNLILGKETSTKNKIREIEIKVGSLSPKKFFFPFLWCFEDLILEHEIDCWQIICGKKKKFPPFSGYQKEKFFGIKCESYFGQSDLEYLILPLKIPNFKFRLIRPEGFFYFFQFLKNYGFLKKKNLPQTKKILQEKKEDNLTVGEIKISSTFQKIVWKIKSFSKKGEKLNSMQKITGLMVAIITHLIFEKKIQKRGILPLEEIGKDKKLFDEILKKLKKEKILVNRILK